MLQLHINMLSTDDVDSMIGLIAKLMNGLIQYIYPSKSVPQYVGTYFIQGGERVEIGSNYFHLFMKLYEAHVACFNSAYA